MNELRRMQIEATAEWTRQMDERAKRDRGEQVAAVPQVSIEGLSPSQALESVFGTIPAPRQPKNHDRPPEPAPGAPAAAPAEPLDGAPPTRLSDVLEALAAPPAAAAPVTPSAMVRQALAALEPEQRAAVEAAVVARLGGLQHLGQGQEAYKASLVVGWMAGRVADAKRLAPDTSATDVLTSLLPAPEAGGEA